MDKIGKEKGKWRFIILPLQPESTKSFNGVGLALHFLLGNTVVLNTNLKEFWFGWRTKKIFPTQKDLTAYIYGQNEPIDFKKLSIEQEIRFWLHGHVKETRAVLTVYDGSVDTGENTLINFSAEDHLVGFRRVFIEKLSGYGIPFPDEMKQPALWPEKISYEGMDIMGRALESFYYYSSYTDKKSKIDTRLFEKAVALSPESYMAQDMLGWAHYRNKNYTPAKAAFLRAVLVNTAGTGAMSGLMWCGIFIKDKEETLYWASRAAEILGQDIAEARQKTIKRWKKYNP